MARLKLDVPGVWLPATAEDEHQIDGAPGGAELEDLGGVDARAGVPDEREQISGPGPEQQLERLISIHGSEG